MASAVQLIIGTASAIPSAAPSASGVEARAEAAQSAKHADTIQSHGVPFGNSF